MIERLLRIRPFRLREVPLDVRPPEIDLDAIRFIGPCPYPGCTESDEEDHSVHADPRRTRDRRRAAQDRVTPRPPRIYAVCDELHVWEDAVSGDGMATLEEHRQRLMEAVAERRVRAVRAIVEDHLPRRLHWLIDRPRLLAIAYRIRPRWRPHVELYPMTIDVSTAGDTTIVSAAQALRDATDD